MVPRFLPLRISVAVETSLSEIVITMEICHHKNGVVDGKVP